MDLRDDSSRFGPLPTSLRNPSSSSSTFFSASQSPFFSPKSATCRLSTSSDNPCHSASVNMDSLNAYLGNVDSESLTSIRFASTEVNPGAEACTSNDRQELENVSSSTGVYSSYGVLHSNDYSRHKGKGKKIGRLLEVSAPPASFSSNRLRSCDVYIGFHGHKPLLLRKSFRNPYTIEELRFFSGKKNLVPVYFDVAPDECLVRDIIEKRGELWEKYGGELWLLYGGVEKEWRDAVNALSRVDDWKLEAHDGKWRDCILRAVSLLALRLGRRSVVDRLTKWREKAEKEEFPFPQNENFVGRKKELSELEFILFGDVCGDSERDFFELKARPRRKNLTIGWGRTNSLDEKRRDRQSESSKKKGKEPVVWKESEKEIEMQNAEFSKPHPLTPKSKSSGKHGRRRRSMKVVYGKGIACVSGDTGVGKTELLLEFAYRFHQREVLKIYRLQKFDALRAIEEKLGRLPLGLAIVGAILSELPINPSRLLDTINRMPSRDVTWSGRENHLLRRNNFLLQLFEVCFSIFDHADGPRSLATRMVLASGWFAPAPIPIPILALAAHKIPEKHQHRRLWKRIMYSLTCGFSSSYARRSEAEASSLLLRFNMARSCTKDGLIQFNHLVKLYARKRGITGLAQSMVQAVISRGSISHHSDHIWAACFLLLGFGKDPIVVELKVSELLFLVKEVILPLAIRTFITFSRCTAALELLRLCTDALEAADQAFVTPVEKWLDKSLCWKPVQTNAQLNPCIWQELALARATVLEVRAKLMARGGQYDIGDDLIRKAIFIRTSICGEDHPDTVTARETLSKLTRLIASVQTHTSP
ncbi:UNVERIFIED_CONTAM: hypothetical protein Scaly_0865000 [Sesamum calycinum]|uniref:Plant disease resistance WDH domain-containing protein n=1 Tax=Sesamum calycinum TaxID=2727403 RepID=A0AAW2QVW3_9LAMI